MQAHELSFYHLDKASLIHWLDPRLGLVSDMCNGLSFVQGGCDDVRHSALNQRSVLDAQGVR